VLRAVRQYAETRSAVLYNIIYEYITEARRHNARALSTRWIIIVIIIIIIIRASYSQADNEQ